jgi:hypothetical protein
VLECLRDRDMVLSQRDGQIFSGLPGEADGHGIETHHLGGGGRQEVGNGGHDHVYY